MHLVFQFVVKPGQNQVCSCVPRLSWEVEARVQSDAADDRKGCMRKTRAGNVNRISV